MSFSESMDHIAIMGPKWKLIPRILSGEKTIESRWYKTRRAPWGMIHVGDTVYFKDSGKLITAKATVSSVWSFDHLTIEMAHDIVHKYGKEICIQDHDIATWADGKNYAILIGLKDPVPVLEPFGIDKTGMGAGAAWITVSSITQILR